MQREEMQEYLASTKTQRRHLQGSEPSEYLLNETQNVPASSKEVWAQASLSGVASITKPCGGKKEK